MKLPRHLGDRAYLANRASNNAASCRLAGARGCLGFGFASTEAESESDDAIKAVKSADSISFFDSLRRVRKTRSESS